MRGGRGRGEERGGVGEWLVGWRTCCCSGFLLAGWPLPVASLADELGACCCWVEAVVLAGVVACISNQDGGGGCGDVKGWATGESCIRGRWEAACRAA